jgi:hypothetical protein
MRIRGCDARLLVGCGTSTDAKNSQHEQTGDRNTTE